MELQRTSTGQPSWAPLVKWLTCYCVTSYHLATLREVIYQDSGNSKYHFKPKLLSMNRILIFSICTSTRSMGLISSEWNLGMNIACCSKRSNILWALFFSFQKLLWYDNFYHLLLHKFVCIHCPLLWHHSQTFGVAIWKSHWLRSTIDQTTYNEEGLVIGAFLPGLTFIRWATRASSSYVVWVLAWSNTKISYLSAGYLKAAIRAALATWRQKWSAVKYPSCSSPMCMTWHRSVHLVLVHPFWLSDCENLR